MVHWIANKESVMLYDLLKSLGLAGNGKSTETIKVSTDIRHLYAMYS